MAKFNFRLATLLRIREAARDERRAQLADAYAAEAKLAERRQTLQNDLVQLVRQHQHSAQPGPVDVDRLVNTHRYQMVIKGEMQLLQQQSTAIAAEIEKRRAALVAADREVRVLEKLREKKYEHYRDEQALRESKQLDEVAGRLGVGEDVK